MKKIAVPFTVLVALFFGVGGIFPAPAKLRDTGGIPSTFVGSYTGVFLLTAVAASRVSYLISRRKGV